MKVFTSGLSIIIFIAAISTGLSVSTPLAEAQSATPLTDSMPARDAVTSAEDIMLTNSCIEGGKEKIYCLCKTKIFKNEMSLRDYRAAVRLSGQSNASNRLIKANYSPDDTAKITVLSKILLDENKFRTRCHKAETFFAMRETG